MTAFPFPNQFSLAEVAEMDRWRERYSDSFIARTRDCWPVGKRRADIVAFLARNPRPKRDAA